MPPAAQPKLVPIAEATPRDAAALQAFAARALAETPPPAAGQRGPFRPKVWLNARARGAVRLSAHYFRAFDVLAAIALTLLCAAAVAPQGLIHASVAQVLPFALGCGLMLGLIRSAGLYRFGRGERLALHLARLSGAVLAGGAVALLAALVLSGAAAPVTALLIWTALCLLGLYGLHCGWWDLVARWRADGRLTPNIVIVGATRNAERLIREALKRREVNVLGVFDDRLARAPHSVEGVPVLGDTRALIGHKIAPYVDKVVLAVDPSARARVQQLHERLAALPNEVTLLVDPQGRLERDAALAKLADAPLAPLDGIADADRRAFHKRLQDLLIGGAALIALAPLFALIALAVRLDSPGPAFFRQRRHGFNNEEIVVWKFRTMRTEASDATASRQVTADDDRVTRVGRFLRKTSLDELPQLINVVAGEMSLVGPRPHAIGMKTGETESARLVADYAHRHRIKPGMTGWAAIKGSRGPLHSAAEVRRRVQLDVDYIERQSLWLDLWIMLVTVPVLLGDRSAVR